MHNFDVLRRSHSISENLIIERLLGRVRQALQRQNPSASKEGVRPARLLLQRVPTTMTVAQWLLPQPLLEPHLPSLPLTDRSGSRRVRRAAGRIMGVRRSDPVHWLCTNVRHLLHRIDDLETRMAVLS